MIALIETLDFPETYVNLMNTLQFKQTMNLFVCNIARFFVICLNVEANLLQALMVPEYWEVLHWSKIKPWLL